MVINLFIIVAVIPASVGSTCLLGMPINVLVPMTPFIGLVIILNSLMIYQITDVWHRITAHLVKNTNVIATETAEFIKKQNHSNGRKNTNTVFYRPSKGERLGHLYQIISHDYLTFFFVNTIGFGVTAYFSIPNYQMAFTFFAFIILYLCILQLFFFCPIIMLTCNCYDDDELPYKVSSTATPGSPSNRKSKKSTTRSIKRYFSLNVVTPYSKFIKTSLGKLIFISIFCIMFLWPATYGIRHIKNHMDLRKILPNDSPNLKAFDFMDQHVWNDFLQYIFIMNNPPDFEDPHQFGRFRVSYFKKRENVLKIKGFKSPVRISLL